jgi:hypothetical protein
MSTKNIILSNNQEVEVLQYLPMVSKATFISFLANESFVDSEDGIKVFSPIELELNRIYAYIKFYTNVKFNNKENLYDIYDQYKSSGDFEKILDAIPESEISVIENSIYEAIEEKKREQSEIGIVLAKFLEKVNSKIPDSKGINKLIKSLGKEIKGLSPENIEMLKGLLGQDIKKSGGK